MKRFFAVFIIFALIFAACLADEENNSGNTDGNNTDGNNTGDDNNNNGNNNSGNNSDVIGIWTGSYKYTGYTTAGSIKLDISESTWVLVFTNPSGTLTTYNGTWTRSGNILTLRATGQYYTASASLSGSVLILNQPWESGFYGPETSELTKGGSTGGTGGTTLKINNLSFTEITDVIWQNVTFANNNYENSIKPSTNVTNTVQAGAGYIFFKRKSNPITARTRDMVVVIDGENIEFTFNDNTIIVEINNPNNNGTLGALQSTVVWWDDAEGEMQPYYEARSFVGYYANSSGLLSGYGDYYYSPKNGNKSIGIGGTITALLHLKINLTRNAKLSFWYANRNYSGSTNNAVFSINGVEKRSWTTDVNWSFIEFDLEPGLNDLIWEKKDGRSTGWGYYLTLDDILIYYTE